jgi:hypothetical protein
VPAPLDTRQKLTLQIVEMSKIPDTFPSKLPELQIKMSKSSSIKTIRCCAQHKLSKTSILLADLKRNGELDRWIVLAKKTTTMLSR